jgi:transposase
MAVEGFTTKEVFEAYTEHFLSPALREGQAVVMDNLGAHKGERGRELIEGKGCKHPPLAALLAGPQPHRGGLFED